VVERLQQRYGHASAERAVSGQGLVDVFEALCATDQRPTTPTWTPAGITEHALARQDAHCTEALDMFCAFLGSVAGNLALTLGARGGVYVGGGIVPRLGTWLDQSPFRVRFEAKGRFEPYLRGIPVWVVTATQSPALAGAARALDSL
jgi:glucokinase